ncbi:DUF2225 domain-containing protein [Alkaliphilus serpentinus]|uniref:DUF2225 domain-containing protein n=1 Tax=Alkaliphilus serpentinus TaxID=1482731 RepID=A0A833HN36_9FIRM|nr:DUF2225 domain-containing protein [Alkaliphilus serpentinus]KAB3529149.1 DUF2225 domain-containing protein [Alkaliphilus serpentinus]
MTDLLYDKRVECSICRWEFTTKKVKNRGLKVLERQDDFNVVYRDINPNYYYIWVCPNCGFSATETEFHEVNTVQKNIYMDLVRKKWVPRDFGGYRTAKEAEEVFKLALLTAQLLKKPKAYIGGLCLRLAWIYREMGNSKEQEFLKHALDNFTESYSGEKLPLAGFDDLTMAYFIGELSRKMGRYRDAIKWYSKTLDNPGIKDKRQLQLKTREQWKRAKEEYDREKGSHGAGEIKE